MIDLLRDTIGLSYSGINDLMISPLRYWHKHLNPERVKPDPTPAMEFGRAAHCAVLEPDRFDVRYCRRFDAADVEGCLQTVPDIKQWIIDKGGKPKTVAKSLLIDQAMKIDPNVPIYDVLRLVHGDKHAGKVELTAEDWERLQGVREALRNEVLLAEILAEGEAEMPFVVQHEGINLKARMDWITPDETLDIKTFSDFRKIPIDKIITNAIFYEHYYRQGYFYSLIRAIANGNTDSSAAQTAPRFIFVFVESDPPHETRIRELKPKESGQACMLWERARIECNWAINIYREYMDKFGVEKPWRYAQKIEALVDEEFPALAYGG